MATKKALENYLPQKDALRPVQGNVKCKSFSGVNKYRKAKNLTWSELIEALFQRLLDETRTS